MSRIAELWSGLTPNARRGVVGGAVGVAAVGLVAAIALGGGGGGDDAAPKANATTTTAVTTTAPPTTTTAPPTGPVAPLTGLQVPQEDALLLLRPPLAVKVDNLDAPKESAVPQTALPKADVVYEEVVEGNITRLVAVFHSQQPGTVGPVRSARTTDVELLPQLGRPLLAWSGGNAGVVNAVQSSPYIINAGADAMPGSYFRDGSRRAPHNLYARGDELWAKAPPGTPPPPALFPYRKKGEKNPPSARKAQGVDLSWGGGAASSNVSWRWDPKARVYLREQRGRPHRDSGGGQLTAKNVVVMVTEYVPSYADSRSPQAKTVGSGELFVFTNGRVLHGRWDRPDIAKPATLVDDQGQPVLLSPGQTWIELPKAGGTAAITR